MNRSIAAAAGETVFRDTYQPRSLRNSMFKVMVTMPAVLILALMVFIVVQVLFNGARALNLEFLIAEQRPFGEPGGGVVQAIVGTLMLIVIATLLSFPLALLGALFLHLESGRRSARILEGAINMLQGIPSIVVGVVVYRWIVVPMKSFSALAGGAALAIIMLPLLVGMMREALRLVPASYMEAALALGAPRWRAVAGIIVPAARSGIIEALGLGIARAAGETAPLMFTAFGNPFLSVSLRGPVAALPLVIYEYIKSPYDDWHQKAWGAAFLLMVFVLSLNLVISARKNHIR
ncbi:MAG: phosphate ABC transporter permease PstA [Rectinemataceae bacterium]|nr:phosphate ABC transporter permease PstA [Spirochaetaceae bacterium]